MINNNWRVDNRRNWKGQVVDYDAIKAYEAHECLYCLTDAQVAVLSGIIEPLAWQTRWQSDTQSIDQGWTEQFRNDIQRRLSMGCCGDETPIQYQWTEDGVLQKSTDGGLTWEDAPDDDPRNNSTRYPPAPGADGDDKKCVAATGMAALIKQQVGDQLTDDMARYTLGELIQNWVDTFIQTANIFTALITIATNQIFALSIAILRPALTDAVYDTLKCILYCHMEDDATFTQAQIDAIRADIGDQIGGVASLFLQQLIFLMGVVGLSNLARSQAATEGDCEDCACGEGCSNNWTVNQAGSIEPDNEWLIMTSAPFGPDAGFVDIITPTIDDCCFTVNIEVLSGSVTQFNHINCGYARVLGNLISSTNWLDHQGKCINYLALASSEPFVCRVSFIDCPP